MHTGRFQSMRSAQTIMAVNRGLQQQPCNRTALAAWVSGLGGTAVLKNRVANKLWCKGQAVSTALHSLFASAQAPSQHQPCPGRKVDNLPAVLSTTTSPDLLCSGMRVHLRANEARQSMSAQVRFVAGLQDERQTITPLLC